MRRRHLERNTELFGAKERVSIHKHALRWNIARHRLAPVLEELQIVDGQDLERHVRPLFMLFEQQIRKGRVEIEKKVRLARIDGRRGAHMILPGALLVAAAVEPATVAASFDITWCAERCLPEHRVRRPGRRSAAAAQSLYVRAARRTGRR